MTTLPSIAIAQIDPTVGDIPGNTQLILKAYGEAQKQGAQLVVTPELSLIGYPPEDLILMPAFRAKAIAAAKDIAAKTTAGCALIFGSVWEEDGKIYNAALLAEGGKIVHVQPKTALPNYGVFDEKRLFEAGQGSLIYNWHGLSLGILVCEDVWHEELSHALKEQGAQLIVVINASPFERNKLAQRKELVIAAAKHTKAPIVYVNMVGGQDDIIFDGGSFAVDAAGMVTMQCAQFSAQVALTTPGVVQAMGEEETLWSAMVLGLRDYVRKNGFSGVVLGLSGGIDSAISAAVAVEALGAGNVEGVLLPSPYTSQESIDDALETAKLLGIQTRTVAITPMMETASAVLTPVFEGKNAWMEDPAIGGNLQARIRGQLLMAISNQTGRMLMNTSNKSEVAVGYSTLYGDSCGAYCVLKDLYKTQVFGLSKWRNTKGLVIPVRSITKPPSAELRPGQKDEDQLPPYDLLDAILVRHIEQRQGAQEIIAQGYDRAVVERVLQLVRVFEYKRRQSCPGVKLSSMYFGKDRRYPLTNRSNV